MSFILFACTACLAISPFHIDFAPNANVSNEDYIDIQKQLKQIDTRNLVDPYLVTAEDHVLKGNCWGRYVTGLIQTMIDPEKGLFPLMELVKIGTGGDRCVVSFASYNRDYHSLIKKIPSALESSGFNGYFFYRIGGFPNPNGYEIQYAGVPYCFKIFMMQEARNFGFDKLLWIDSSALPLKDPSPLFEIIEKKGGFFNGWQLDSTKPRPIFSEARKSLIDFTDTDVHHATYIQGGIFGLDLSHPQAQQFVSEYYSMVEMGIPFLSCFPEEYVFMALLGKEKNKIWVQNLFPRLLIGPSNKESELEIQKMKNDGYFFYIRNH